MVRFNPSKPAFRFLFSIIPLIHTQMLYSEVIQGTRF